MTENPIPAIEAAELAARQTVQKANEDKNSLIHAAREKADLDLSAAIQKARAESENMIRLEEQKIKAAGSEFDSSFEEEKAGIIRKATEREDAAISRILEIIVN